MNSDRKAYALVWVIPIAVAVTWLRADTPAAASFTSIYFLGRQAASEDKGFQRLKAALDQLPEVRLNRLRLEFVNAGPGEPIQLANAARMTAARGPGIIVAPTGAAAIAARQHAPGVPMVFASYLDPVRHGIVSALLKRPEPVVGVWISDHLDAKRLEILHDAYPSARRIAVLGDRTWGQEVQAERHLPQRARALGLDLTVLYADTLIEAERVLATPEAVHYDAWVLPRSGLAVQGSLQIVERMRRWKKPVMMASTADVKAGAPMSYAIDTSFAWPALAKLVSRVAAGEPPGQIPIEQPQRFVLAVRTGDETGLPPPSSSVVRRADLVIR